MSGSESQPRKIKLTCEHSIKMHNYHESLHMAMKPVIVPTETSLAALVHSLY